MAKKGPVGGNLFDNLISNTTSRYVNPILKSKMLQPQEFCPTDVPLFNLALSGKLDGGVSSNGGLTVIAGPSKHFKTLYAFKMMEAFSKKHKDGVMLFYDSEFGSTKEYLSSFDIDLERVIHIPVTTIEQLRHETAKQLKFLEDEAQKGALKQKVFVMIDSLGNLASEKETTDAESGKDKADMTRAKAAKSFYRIVTPKLNLLGIPAVVIAHTYKSQDFIPRDIVAGGEGSMFSSNSVFVIGKKQDKSSSGDLNGWQFIIKIEKSRFIKEKSKLPITVHYGKGILPYSGLAELATQLKIIKPCRINRTTGYEYKDDENEIQIPASEIDRSANFWDIIFTNTDFKQRVEDYYSLEVKAQDISDFIEIEEDAS